MSASQATSIKPRFRTVDGLNIRYSDSGGASRPVVLLTSPWPQSIYAFAPMWGMLPGDARLFAIDLPGFGASAYPEQLPALAELLPRIEVPVTIVNGRHDRVVPVANAEFLDERLPNSRLEHIDAGHFVWEECTVDYAAVILNSIFDDESSR